MGNEPLHETEMEAIVSGLVHEPNSRPVILLISYPEEEENVIRRMLHLHRFWTGLESKKNPWDESCTAVKLVHELQSIPEGSLLIVQGLSRLPDRNFDSFWKDLDSLRDLLPDKKSLVLCVDVTRIQHAALLAPSLYSIARVFRPGGKTIRLIPEDLVVEPLLEELRHLKTMHGMSNHQFLNRWRQDRNGGISPEDARRWIHILQLLQDDPRIDG